MAIHKSGISFAWIDAPIDNGCNRFGDMFSALCLISWKDAKTGQRLHCAIELPAQLPKQQVGCGTMQFVEHLKVLNFEELQNVQRHAFWKFALKNEMTVTKSETKP